MLVETGLFAEDERKESFDIIKGYFPEAVALSSMQVFEMRRAPIQSVVSQFRGSMALASKLGNRFEYANALNWMPAFKRHLLNDQYIFLDFETIVENAESIRNNAKMFVRPVSPFKDFAGQAFTKEKLRTEFDFAVKNKNISPYTICVLAPIQEIKREYRFVFVDNELVSGCMYMESDELTKEPRVVPAQAFQKAREVGTSDYFQNIFNYVVDIAEDAHGNFKLIEINGFQTASFYWCDLHAIYEAWRKSLEDEIDF